MSRILEFAFLFFLGACFEGVDPNGSWNSPDARVVFYDWDGGAYWGASTITLKHAAAVFDDECSRFSMSGGRLVWVKAFAPTTVAVAQGRDVRLFVTVDEFSLNEGYHIVHRDAGTVGLVRLSFDAGFFIEGPQRGVLRWRADYRDDVRQLESEGGEIWVDRHQSSCL